MTEPANNLDEIDRKILGILAQDPRTPYADVAEQLAEAGHEMSTEGVRYRVSNLFETTSVLLTTDPTEYGWEVLRVLVSLAGDADHKAETFDRLTRMEFWMVCRVMGSFDLYAVATVPSNREADDLVGRVRGLDHVAGVEYTIETGRETTTANYLAF
ncbi:MAG: Lrp/AsnC family transcriptional regulator [Salinirussus sp.]